MTATTYCYHHHYNQPQVLVMPEFTSTVRSLTSRVSAKALYSGSERDELSTGVRAAWLMFLLRVVCASVCVPCRACFGFALGE